MTKKIKKYTKSLKSKRFWYIVNSTVTKTFWIFAFYTFITRRKKMKKRVLSILLVAAMTASLTACGGSDSSNNSASGSGEITLTIPTHFVGENVGAVYFEPAVERFNEANKGKYHIEL